MSGGEDWAPFSARMRVAMVESSAVVMPGRTAAVMARRALATIWPQARSFSSCSAVVMDMGPRLRDQKRKAKAHSQKWLCYSVAAATTAAATAATGGAAGRSGGAARAGRGEDGKLDRGFFAGALGAGDFLLLIDDDFFELRLAVVADVFVDGHGVSSF